MCSIHSTLFLTGAAGSRFTQGDEPCPSADDHWDADPWDDAPGAMEQVMTSWEDLSTGLDRELTIALASFPLPAVDPRPAAPVTAEVPQGELAPDAEPLRHARSRALDDVLDLDAREARLFARRVDTLVQVGRLTDASGTRGPGAPLRSLALDLGGTRRLGQAKALSDLHTAQRLTTTLTLTLAGLRVGTLLLGQAQAILGATQHCPDDITVEVERRLFANPRSGLLGPSELRRELARLILEVEAELDPDAQRKREQSAIDGRHVRSFPLPDGMCGKYAEMTAEQGLSHDAALDTLCGHVKTHDDAHGITRTATQRRADVLACLPGWVLQLLDERREAWARQDGPGSDDTDTDTDTGTGTVLGTDLWTGTGEGSDGESADRPGAVPLAGPDPSPPPHPSPPPEEPLIPTCAPPVQLPYGATPDGLVAHIHIPLATALGQSDAPAWLDGHGWVSAGTARRMQPGATLRPVHVDEHGQPVHTEPPAPPRNTGASSGSASRTSTRAWMPVRPQRTHQAVRVQLLRWARLTRTAPPTVITTPEPRYEPSSALARHVRIRDHVCTGPGCAQPHQRTQLDHLQPYDHGNPSAGGPTVAWNLGGKSARCHNAKTHGGWQSTRHPDGSTTWTSPLARCYWTPAFWPPPPLVDPNRPLPDPDSFDVTPPDGTWAFDDGDHEPWLRAALDAERRREQIVHERDQQAQARRGTRPRTAGELYNEPPPPGPDSEPPPF